MDNPGEDSRMLAAVFQDIMPVLARIQMRSPQAILPGSFGQMSAESTAAVALVSDLGADSLRRLTAYLDVNAERFEGLENCAPLVAAAARALAARDYAQTFTLIFDIYRTIAMLRADDQKLPLPGSIKNVAMEGRKGDEARQSAGDNQESSSGPPH
jgi:hypothetical protein